MSVCYDFNGNQDNSLYPCSTDGSPSQCCEMYELCASDGLCVNNGTDPGLAKYATRGCTVQDWTDGQVDTCISECIPTGGVGVSNCGVGSFCCYGFEGCDCDNSTQVFSIDPVSIVATISSTSTSTPSATTSPSTSATPTGDPDASDSGSSSHLGLGLGIGLGVGVPLLAAAILIPFFLRRRKNSKSPIEPTDKGGYYQPPPAQAETHDGVLSPAYLSTGPVTPGPGQQAPPYTETQAYELPHQPIQQMPHELQ
ncbi:uncharacterized protein BDV14DRAFT_169920 [Aspergillus stella-maris]|uniref:uncharacterized protein n=1 Tax=Aspergillus stella-maris TaxID=1810926 RepID=UPI003CCDE16F